MSRQRREFVVFGFASVHDTLAGEDSLRAAGVPVVTIPSPAELGRLCGIALRVAPVDADCAEAALLASGSRFEARADITDI